MRTFLLLLDDFLRGRGDFAIEVPLAKRVKWLVALIVIPGFIYGAVMGSYSALAPGRVHQMVYSGLKVPMFLLVTCLLCLPSFFVVNTICGLRDDFVPALRAIVTTQACASIVLASLAPLTALFYASCGDYQAAVAINGLMFFVACLATQLVIRRYYSPLIEKSPRHRGMLYTWFFLYVFVGIQMGWVLRPFIGAPLVPVSFFRSGAWGNAYVRLMHLVPDAISELSSL